MIQLAFYYFNLNRIICLMDVKFYSYIVGDNNLKRQKNELSEMRI
jgi:hypothetical protein